MAQVVQHFQAKIQFNLILENKQTMHKELEKEGQRFQN